MGDDEERKAQSYREEFVFINTRTATGSNLPLAVFQMYVTDFQRNIHVSQSLTFPFSKSLLLKLF